MIAIQHLAPGTQLRLRDGTTVEIVENPRDGVWLVARAIDAQGRAADDTQLVHADDVSEVAGSTS
jgi:hypothetical protein